MQMAKFHCFLWLEEFHYFYGFLITQLIHEDSLHENIADKAKVVLVESTLNHSPSNLKRHYRVMGKSL